MDGEARGATCFVLRHRPRHCDRPRSDGRARNRKHGAYRARLVFPKPGRWTLSARAGGSSSRLGAVSVRRRVEPLAFDNPTSVAVEPSGSLLVVENGAGKVDRVDPATGAKTVVASGLSRPYSVTVTPSAEILLSTQGDVVRLGSGTPQIVTSLPGIEIGPILASPNGDLYLGAEPGVFRVPAGSTVPAQLVGGLAAPHGLAFTADGSLLVSDTGHDVIVRIDPVTGKAQTFAHQLGPLGLAVASDRSIYVCDDVAKRIVHFSAGGERLGFAGPVFNIPYGLAADPAGGVYVTEATATGRHQAHLARRHRHDAFFSLTTGRTLTETKVSAAPAGGSARLRSSWVSAYRRIPSSRASSGVMRMNQFATAAASCHSAGTSCVMNRWRISSSRAKKSAAHRWLIARPSPSGSFGKTTSSGSRRHQRSRFVPSSGASAIAPTRPSIRRW